MNLSRGDKTEVDLLIELKKKTLLHHVPFIREMIVNLKGTEFEAKWQTMFDCITSDKKRYDNNALQSQLISKSTIFLE